MTERTEIVREALRQTELRLEDLQSLASAAENRAFQYSAACVLFATLLSGLVSKLPDPFTGWGLVIGALVSASVAMATTFPRRFHVRGHFLGDWRGHLDAGDTLFHAMLSQAKENDDRIVFNEQRLEDSASNFFLSLLILALALGIFLLGQFLSS